MRIGIFKRNTSNRKTINNDIINSVVKEETAKKNKSNSNILGALNGKSNAFKNSVMSKYNMYYTNGGFNRHLRRMIRNKSGIPESREVRFNTLPNSTKKSGMPESRQVIFNKLPISTKKMNRKRVNARNNVTKSKNKSIIPVQRSTHGNISLNDPNVATQGNNISLNNTENTSLNAPNVAARGSAAQGTRF